MSNPTADQFDPVTGCAADSNFAVPDVKADYPAGKPPISGGGDIPTKGVPTDGKSGRK